jgi:hypothetical protein
MTIPQLIDKSLRACEGFERYQGDTGKLRFIRERNPLIKAIMRFGYECHQRGWDFSAEEIIAPIQVVIQCAKDREFEREIKGWLPVYLEGAIDRHIRLKAEEYNAKAKEHKSAKYIVAKAMAGIKAVEAIREPTQCEMQAAAYKNLQRDTKKHARAAHARKDGQAQLL